jgi:hypothetical protein
LGFPIQEPGGRLTLKQRADADAEVVVINVPSRAQYAETPEVYAKRVAHVPKPSKAKAEGFKEVVLLFKQSDWVRFKRTVACLKKEQGWSGTEAVMFAMDQAFPSVWRAEDQEG